MTFVRSFGISGAVHLVLVGTVLLAGRLSAPVDYVERVVQIRIRAQGLAAERAAERPSGGDPSGIPRSGRPAGELPATESGKYSEDSLMQEDSRAVPERSAPVAQQAETRTVLPDDPGIDSVIGNLGAPDPLLGLIETESGSGGHSAPSDERWSVSWSNGEERGILEFPRIDRELLPESAERLTGIEIRIEVSSAGDVVSAEIVPPGSGDVRIDRYINELALGLLLEPGFAGDDAMTGLLRLVFLEGRE